ncbi:MAG: hypothetical protein ACTSX6_01900 [Candidatus Heimdallarchaeaceae archaeon]
MYMSPYLHLINPFINDKESLKVEDTDLSHSLYDFVSDKATIIPLDIEWHLINPIVIKLSII